MAEFPALPLFTDAYLGDTTHLTTLEHGAYLLLLMTAWRSKDGTLPDDDKKLSRFCRMNMANWLKIKPIISEFFQISDGAWLQLRLKDELRRLQNISAVNSEKGKISALKTKERHLTAVASRLQPNVNRASTPTPTPTPTPTINPLLSPKRGKPVPQDFNEFWESYPKTRAGSKAKAEQAYDAAIKRGATAEQILQGVTAYASSDEVSRGFGKGCAAWLNDERYNNAYSAMGPAQGTTTGGHRGFDALAVAAAKIQADVEGREIEDLKYSDPALYLRRKYLGAGGGGNSTRGVDASDVEQPYAALAGPGSGQENRANNDEQ